MNKINRIIIVGMGALGVMYGDWLVRHLGTDRVRFLADPERVARYQREGVFCNDRPCDFRYLSSAEECEPADLMIFAVKATGLRQAIETARPAVGKNTIFLSVMNGITSEEELAAAFGPERVLYCIVQGMDAVKFGSRGAWKNLGKVYFGAPAEQAEKQPLADLVEDLFTEAELPYVRETAIMRRLWAKWMLNVGINQVCMLTEGTYGTLQQPGPARDRVIAAQREVLALSEAAGVNLNEADIAFNLSLLDSLSPEMMPSMRQDGLAKRKSEVELFAGAVIRKGKELGVPTPVNEQIYREVLAKEAAY